MPIAWAIFWAGSLLTTSYVVGTNVDFVDKTDENFIGPPEAPDPLGINKGLKGIGDSIRDKIGDVKKVLIGGGLLWIVLSTKPWK